MNEQQTRLDKTIGRIEQYQKTLKLNDTRFCARYGDYVGTQKTWRNRLAARNWSEIGRTLTGWEEKLNKLLAILDGGQDIGDFYDSLPIAKYGQDIFDQLQGRDDDRRVAFVIGPTGVGKSWLLKWLAKNNREEFPGCVYVYANECWSESMPQIAKGLAAVVNATVDKTSGRNTFANVTTILRAVPMTLCIDDMQKAGVLGLQLIKSLVDDTRAKFILGVYPTSWNKLISGSTDAMAEAQQILGRSIKPIATRWKDGMRVEDIEAYMVAAGISGDIHTIALRLEQRVRKYGGLRLVADAVGLAHLNADEQDIPFDAALFEAAVIEFCPEEQQKGKR